MSEQNTAPELPPSQPELVVGDSPVDPAPQIGEAAEEILRRLRTISVTPNEVRRLAAVDKCVQRLNRELEAARAEKVPSRIQLEAAKKNLLLAHQRLSELRSARETKASTERMLEAQLLQRLNTIAEKEEGRRVRAIRQRIAPQFRPGLG